MESKKEEDYTKLLSEEAKKLESLIRSGWGTKDPNKGTEIEDEEIAELYKDAWWASLTPREKQALFDMFWQNMLMIESSRKLKFDPRHTIRIAMTQKRDERGRPIVAITSPSEKIAKDIVHSMSNVVFTAHNKSTGKFKLSDLKDRKCTQVPKPKGGGWEANGKE
jgi:hypothetical protein